MLVCFVAQGYDNGKSGISKYMKYAFEYLQNDYELLVITDEESRKVFKESENIQVLSLGKLANYPLISVLFSLFLVPLIAIIKNCDAIFLPAINRRVVISGLCRTWLIIDCCD